jgi:cytochrome c oxidase subunit 1
VFVVAAVTAIVVCRQRSRQPVTDGGEAASHSEKPSGLRRWLTTVDHRDVGLLYLLFGLVAGLWGGVDALMMRFELVTPGATVWDVETYNALFTTHGITMLFFFAAPVFFGIANYVIPLLVDADDMAFPRINAIAFWLLPPSIALARAGLITEITGKGLQYVAGVTAGLTGGWLSGVVDALLLLEPPATGWTLYTPLSIQMPNPQVDLLLLGLHLSGIATTMGAINFIVTIVSSRGERVSWADLDLFSWNILTTSGIVLFAFPVLGSALIMLLLDRNFGTTFFTGEGGGPLLWQHLFWFFGHPEVYILVLPAFGLLSYILPKFADRELFGFRFVVYSTLAIGVLSFGVWAHHMFATGIDPRIRTSFMAVSLAIAVPSAVKTFNWITTMWNGRIRLTAPMLLCIGGISLFVIGGITGVFLASIPVNLLVHDTYYVVGHFHLIIMGVIPFSMLAASYYWFPLATGRMYHQRLARVQATLFTVGSWVAFPPMLVTGMEGLPRRYAVYPAEFAPLQQLATVGAIILGAGGALWLFTMVQSYRTGPKVTDPDPWDLADSGQFTIEWEWFAHRIGAEVPDAGHGSSSNPDADTPEDSDSDPNAGSGAPPSREEVISGYSPLSLVVGVTLAVTALAAASMVVLPVGQFDSTTEALLRTLNRRLLVLAIPLAVFVEVVLLYTVVRFSNREFALPTPDNKQLEIAWTIATGLVLVFAGVISYGVLTAPDVTDTAGAADRPPDAVEVELLSEQFHYTVRYPDANVTREPAETVYVPTDRPVYIRITSTDVLHSVHIPGLGLKQDAFPGQWNVLHTRVTETGDYRLYCAEYCGEDHARMRATIRAVPPDEYRERMAAMNDEPSQSEPSGASTGEQAGPGDRLASQPAAGETPAALVGERLAHDGVGEDDPRRRT